MNGDQLQYEIDNAGVPKEQRSDFPLCSFDADHWAKAFCKQNPGIDVDTARAWFAGALMCGFDEHAKRQRSHFENNHFVGDVPPGFSPHCRPSHAFDPNAEVVQVEDAEQLRSAMQRLENEKPTVFVLRPTEPWWRRIFKRGARS